MLFTSLAAIVSDYYTRIVRAGVSGWGVGDSLVVLLYDVIILLFYLSLAITNILKPKSNRLYKGVGESFVFITWRKRILLFRSAYVATQEIKPEVPYVWAYLTHRSELTFVNVKLEIEAARIVITEWIRQEILFATETISLLFQNV